MTNLSAQIETLREAFGGLERMSDAHYNRLVAILDRASDEALSYAESLAPAPVLPISISPVPVLPVSTSPAPVLLVSISPVCLALLYLGRPCLVSCPSLSCPSLSCPFLVGTAVWPDGSLAWWGRQPCLARPRP